MNMTNREWARAYDLSPDNWQDEYSFSVSRILDLIISAHQNAWELADYYCEGYGSAEERFDTFNSLSEDFSSVVVDEIISSRKPGADFFADHGKNEYCFPYTHAYRFTDLHNYVRFAFLNMMQFNPNFCKCNYCYRYFIPRTKKITRF